LLVDEPPHLLGELEVPFPPDSRVWALPDAETGKPLFQPGLATLGDYGYQARTGYFVWNRERHRYRVGKKRQGTEVPLFWAHNIRPNARCRPGHGDTGAIGFAKLPQEHRAIIRADAILLQRTSNRRQRRRLIAGCVRQADVIGGEGFVAENHTIVISADAAKRQTVPLSALCRLLNTAAVDTRFRRMSGSVSVSTKALRDLPLPTAEAVRRYFGERGLDDEEAAARAYSASVSVAVVGDSPSTARKKHREARR
jgi:adenine-specific DNA-methyltransferase